MGIWDKIQDDLRKNFQEGLDIFKEGSTTVSDKIDKLTGEGKKKYRLFNLNMKVKDEFALLGGQIYDLMLKKSKNPLGSRKVTPIISRIKKLEAEIEKLEMTEEEKARKAPVRKKKTASRKKPAAKTKKS